tara:strand:- start:277 stop:879 length:603 start_codon:yes stop_codon:yes gene_type:complete
MRSPYNYIIKPKGKRYKNSIDVDGKSLILNTEIFNHQYVNREAEIISTPSASSSELNIGDTVIVHHNVFRRWHNIKGKEKNSKAFYKENMYFVSEDQIFAYKRLQNWSRFKQSKWCALKGYCFIKPIKCKDKFSTEEEALIGVVKYTDGSVNVGDLVGFTPNSKYEFIIDGQRLYRVYSKFITIKYEYQGDEEEYNPSWA